MISNTAHYFTICFLLYTSLATALPFSGRVYGGQLAKPGQFPYIVSIQEDVESTGFHGHYCGGSIINSQWILTAGHCVAVEPKAENYHIIAGTTRLNSGGSHYNVSKFILHPGYWFNGTSIAHDIALIKIEGEFTFSDTVTSIEFGDVPENETSTALGWGSTENETIPNELSFVEVTSLYPDVCTIMANGSFWIDLFEPAPSNVCAYTPEGQGMCHGDSGGPLVFNNTLVGVASYILDLNCASKYPDVYTRPTFYRSFIEETIEANS